MLRHQRCCYPLRKETAGSSQGYTSDTKRPFIKQYSISTSEYLFCYVEFYQIHIFIGQKLSNSGRWLKMGVSCWKWEINLDKSRATVKSRKVPGFILEIWRPWFIAD